MTRAVKVKLFLCLTKHHAMKTYWGSGGIAPCILNLETTWKIVTAPPILDLGTRWRLVVCFMPRPLYPRGECPRYILRRATDKNNVIRLKLTVPKNLST
jgi:hypothetical protein